MKKANNNEMDLALHSLAKRGESSLLANSTEGNRENPLTEHLDADELNSFAEGLVPEVARTKYMEHLADCVACRKVVVNLTQTSGPIPQITKTEVERGPGFWDKLSAFLSLPIMRFGVPALALTAVIAIGFLAWRKDRQADFVAQHQPGAETQTVPNTQDSTGKVSEQPSANTRTSLSPVSTPNAAAPITTPPGTGTFMSEPRTEQSPSDSVSHNKPFLKDSDAPPPPPAATANAASKTAGSDTFSERKVGALSSKPASPGEVQKSADKKQEQVNETVAQTRARDETNFERQQEREDDNRAYTANAPSGPRRAEGLAGVRGGYGRKNKRDTTDDETRSVAGRSFRRQGSLWVDTAYASQTTINVRRASEQFRALIADEPAIRDVANSLAGEIILVWKGKAYRIR